MERILAYREFVEKTVLIKTLRNGLESAANRDRLTWRKEIMCRTDEVRESFCDDTGNYKKWLNGEICSFVHPYTKNKIDVQIGDDYEAIYHFLLYCREINAGRKIDENFSEYLAYLISRSVYETEGC